MTAAMTGLCLVWMLVAAPPPSRVQGPLDSARRAEVNGDPRLALQIYQRLMSSDTLSKQEEAQAEARFRWITERSEDDFKPLAQLYKAEAADRENLAIKPLLEFERTVDGFPSGHVRRDARAFIAGALARHHDPEDSLAAYKALLAEPELSPAERQDGAEGTATVAAQLGQLSDAIQYLVAAGLGNEEHARQLRAQRLANVGVPLSWTLIGLFGALAFVSLIVVVGRRRLRTLLSIPRSIVATVIVAIPMGLGALATEEARTLDWQIAAWLAGIMLAANVVVAGLKTMGASRRWIAVSTAAALVAVCAAGFVVADESGLLQSLLRWHHV